MTMPAAPETIGLQPINASEVNNKLGTLLKDFLRVKEAVNHDQDWLLTVDLKATPYFFTDEQETLLKSAIGGLDTDLDGVDMTFINRLIGLV